MKFDDLSPEERIAYKSTVINDFKEHGMSEREALVNYVFCVNPDPLIWLEQRHSIPSDEAEMLRQTGLSKYKENGGEHYCRGVGPRSKGKPEKKACKCRKAIIPE